MSQVPDFYLTFAGPIGPDTTHRLLSAVNGAAQAGANRIHLMIHSYGGVVVEGIVLHNYLTNFPLELFTYNEGAVHSISLLPFLTGKIRKCAPNATFLMHKTTFTFNGPVTAEMMKAQAGSTEINDSVTDAILRQQITMPDDKWEFRNKADLTITAEEALKYGIITEIGHFMPPKGAPLFNV